MVLESAVGNPQQVVGRLEFLGEAERREVSPYLAGIARRLRSGGVAVAVEQIEGGPVEAIVEAARTHGADLIAMTTHGRGGLGRLIFGSHAEAIIHRTPCPVLLVRPGRVEAAVEELKRMGHTPQVVGRPAPSAD